MSHRNLYRRLLSAGTVGMLVLCGTRTGAQIRPAPPGPVLPIPVTVPKYALPDLVVSWLNVEVSCTPKGTVTATIQATVKNQGTIGVANFSAHPFAVSLQGSWFLGGGQIPYMDEPAWPQAGGPKTLKPGESWTTTFSFQAIPKHLKATAGNYFGFRADADPAKLVSESDETNNGVYKYVFDPCYNWTFSR
jgi:hypothetical protein